jgi:hypothetical protein
MPSLRDDFDALRERLRHGRELSNAGFEPVFYLVFPPSQILDVKRETPNWVHRLRQEGWDVSVLSLAEQIEQILGNDPRRALWVMADRQMPTDWKRTNDSLANALTVGDRLLARLDDELQAKAGQERGLLLVTDLEALHPYLRIGSLESRLIGKFTIPTVFLYPGVRTGKTRLKFLGFYPEDGNYRSVHIGG